MEVYRYDPVDMPLPPHRDFVAMVNAASTEDNVNMRGFLDDHVFFVKDVVRDGHHLADLPEHVKALVKEVWARYMPTWGEGRSYPTRILGEVNGGTGSVMLEFTDTPELFGADMRVLGAVDVVDGKITRWADYWDSAAYDGKRFEKIKRTPVEPPLALRSKPAATSARIRDVASKFVEMLSGGDTEGAATLFSYDGVFEDRSLNMKIAGLPAINRYLARVNHKSPFGRGVKLGHVVGGDAGGGFEWASSSSPVKTGAAALSINAEGQITRASIVYDSRNLSATSRNELAALTLEPLQ